MAQPVDPATAPSSWDILAPTDKTPGGWAPGGPRSFKFDQPTADDFDQMLEDSVPGYDDMRHLVTLVARRHLPPDGTLIDLGASLGEASAALIPGCGHAYLLEASSPMRSHLHRRFSHHPNVTVTDIDLRHNYPPVTNVDVTLAVLTLQFIPIEHRQRLLARIVESLTPTGALIIVEKVLGDGDHADDMLRGLHDTHKRSAGRTDDDIARNLLSLEGVLVPMTAAWNEHMLRTAGLRVECFWRHANFVAWRAVRDR